MAKTKPEIKSRASKVQASSAPSPIMKFLPYVVAILTFLVVTLVFFGPMILDDKTLPQGDINQYDGMSKEVRDFRDKTHTEAMWTNSMFGGMPAFQISTEYKGNLIQYVEKGLGLGLPEFTGYMFIACLGFYLLLLVLGINPWLAIAGAIAYSLATYNITLYEAGHNTKVHAIALLPFVVMGFALLWQRRYLIGAGVSAISFSMLISANHVQIAYYLFLTLVIAGVVFLIFSFKDKDIKHYILAFGIFAACGVIGVASNLSLLWTTYEYGNSTIRGKSELTTNTQSNGGLDREYAFGWSYGKLEAFDLMIPNFVGGSSNQLMDEDSKTVQAIHGQTRVLPAYWGDQPFTGGESYMGALIIFLFVLGLVIVDGPFKWWLGIATALSIMLSFGHNLSWFNNFIFDHLPGYNKFRTVTMSLIICQLTLPLLAILTLQKVLNKEIPKERVLTGLYIATGITGGLCLIFAVFGSGLLSFTGGGDKQLQPELLSFLKEDRISLMRMDALRSLFLIVVGAGVVWAVIQEKLSNTIAIAVIVVLCLFDYVGVGKRFINGDSFTDAKSKDMRFTESPADLTILQQEKSLDYRVYNMTVNTFNDASTSYHHKSIGGYHAAKLRRYQELIESQISKGNIAVLNMLNTKWVIQKGAGGQPAAAQNPSACGNAWFVDKVQMVNNADEELKSLDNFDPLQTAFVDKRFANDLKGYTGGKDPASKITMTSYAPNHLVYEYSAPQNQLAVFSEIYYQPGWKATVDGKDLPIVRTDYVLRGAVLPAGNHKVEMVFEPQSYLTGEKVAMGSSVLILLLLGGAVFMEFRNRRSPAPDATAEKS
ncbi:MAG: putative rane protein [Bacteroidetes bacterium]|nr:putative rane protein [Bacteroidota bacterium]